MLIKSFLLVALISTISAAKPSMQNESIDLTVINSDKFELPQKPNILIQQSSICSYIVKKQLIAIAEHLKVDTLIGKSDEK